MFEHKLSLLDYFSASLSTTVRPYDFALRLEFPSNAAPSKENLEAGSLRAMGRYPQTGCLQRGMRWIPISTSKMFVETRTASSIQESKKHFEKFLDEPFDITRSFGVRQLLIQRLDTGQVELVTRMHHALGDGMSLILWLDAQLSENLSPSPAPLVLKRHPSPVRKSPYAFKSPSKPVRTLKKEKLSARRRWRTLSLASGPLQKSFASKNRNFTFNDLLCAVVLKAVRNWNQDDTVALWLPVNIRENHFQGFGNGSSRIRIYYRFEAEGQWSKWAAQVREQVEWCKKNGEWNVPNQDSPFLMVPDWILKRFVSAFAHRPGVDYGSILFTHMARLSASQTQSSEVFKNASDIELVGQLHSAHPICITAVGFRDSTKITFTWDDALYSESDMDQFIELFEAGLSAAFTGVLRDSRD